MYIHIVKRGVSVLIIVSYPEEGHIVSVLIIVSYPEEGCIISVLMILYHATSWRKAFCSVL